MAVGTPNNISFVWCAEDTRNSNNRVAIPDSMVETSMEDRETESELELKRDGGRYENPSSTASNGFVTRTINPRDFETSESYIRTCETCSCIKMCSKLNLKRVHFTLNTCVKCVSIHFSLPGILFMISVSKGCGVHDSNIVCEINWSFSIQDNHD